MTASAVLPARGRSAGGAAASARTWPRRAWGRLRDLAAGRRGRWKQVALWTAVALVLLRVAAPYVASAVINHRLARNTDGPGISGGIDGVSLAVLRGVYQVHGLHLRTRQEGSADSEPLLEVATIRCSLHWSALVRGHLAGNVRIERPTLHVRPAAPRSSTTAPVVVGPGDGTPPSQRWQEASDPLAYVRVDDISVSDGRIHYTDPRRGFSAWIGDVQGRVRDLSLTPGAGTRTASFHLAGSTIGQGAFRIEGVVTPAADRPDLMLRVAVEGIELGRLNPISRHFDGLVFRSGTFSGYAEASVSDGRLSGYFKPLFRNLDIESYRQDQGGAATRLFWRAVVPVVENVLDNDAADQHAARIPLMGTVDRPGTSTWVVVGSTLGNAFVRALVPGFDGFGPTR